MAKFLLWLFILFCLGYGIYFGINWIKIHLNFSSIESEAERLFSPTSNVSYGDVPERLMDKAEEQKIPLKAGDIEMFEDEWSGYRVLSFGYVDSMQIFKSKFLYFKFSFVDTIFYHSK